MAQHGRLAMSSSPRAVPGDAFWKSRRVMIAGGGGFIGSHVVDALQRRGVPNDSMVIPRSRTCDLRLPDNCRRAVEGCDVVLHLAAPTGGISFSRAHPASQYRDCTLINLHLLDAAREAGVAKFVALGNLLAYPAAAASPLREEALYDGPIAATHLGIGLAKRDLVSLSDMCHQEFGMAVVTVLSANAYGPRDHFDAPHAHVIPATIVKCFHDDELVVWGDGSPTRDFLYVEDVAEGMLLAAERLEPPAYVNLASGTEISIGDLVRRIVALTGFRGPVVFDASKGGGDPRRVASTERATRLLGFQPHVPFEQGLQRTIDWYREHAVRS
jgi:GDP-L-fucose synthase